MRNLVVFTPPKLQPLPTYVTAERIASVPLPHKIETLRVAIRKCENLPELEQYRDQAEGLAAAVRTMKHVMPELVRQANLMCKEVIARMGAMLLATGSDFGKSAAAAAGISESDRQHSRRFAEAPAIIRARVIKDDTVLPTAKHMNRAAHPSLAGTYPDTTWFRKLREVGYRLNDLLETRHLIKLTAAHGKEIRSQIKDIRRQLDKLEKLIP